MQTSRVIHLAEVQAGVPFPADERSINFLRSVDVKQQLPIPSNDEVYIVISGRGFLVHGEKLESFETGDCLCIAAGTEHRFQDFSEDLAVWAVVIYAPSGA